MLEEFLEKEVVRNALAKDFVEVKIDTARMTGGREVANRIMRGRGGGIPWLAILDAPRARLQSGRHLVLPGAQPAAPRDETA